MKTDRKSFRADRLLVPRPRVSSGSGPAAAGQKISQLGTAQRVGLERGCLRRCLFVPSRTTFRLAERQPSSRGIKWCGMAILSPQEEQDSARKQSRTGGRPLRRRSEMRSVYGRQRLRGTAALQASSDRRCRHRKLTRKHLEAPWNGGKGGGPWERKANQPAGERGIGP